LRSEEENRITGLEQDCRIRTGFTGLREEVRRGFRKGQMRK